MRKQKIFNKKGSTIGGFVVIIAVAFIAVIMLGVLSYGTGLIKQSFDQIEININQSIGEFDFQEQYAAKLEPALDYIEDGFVVLISQLLLFGMVLTMLLVSYIVKPRGRLWIVLDIFVILVCFFIAAVVSTQYQTYLDSLPTELFDPYSTTLSLASTFVLNIHIVVVTVGALMMMIHYGLATRKREALELPAQEFA